MNTLFTFVLTLYLFPLIRRAVPFSFAERLMATVGIFIPLLDVPVRLVLKQNDFILSGQYFHSVPLNLVFWGILASLVWVYTRSVRFSVLFLLPVSGLLLYALVSLLGTGVEFFWYPLSFQNCHLNIIKEGYLFFSLILILGLLAMYSLSKSHNWIRIAGLSLVVVLIFVMTGVKAFSERNAIKPYTGEASIKSFPLSHFGIKWLVRKGDADQYQFFKWSLFSEKIEVMKPVSRTQDSEVLQVLLMEPEVNSLYSEVFQNPVSEIEIGKEGLELRISEAVPLNDIWWLSSANLKKNRSGRTVQFETTSGFFSLSFVEKTKNSITEP